MLSKVLNFKGVARERWNVECACVELKRVAYAQTSNFYWQVNLRKFRESVNPVKIRRYICMKLEKKGKKAKETI